MVHDLTLDEQAQVHLFAVKKFEVCLAAEVSVLLLLKLGHQVEVSQVIPLVSSCLLRVSVIDHNAAELAILQACRQGRVYDSKAIYNFS